MTAKARLTTQLLAFYQQRYKATQNPVYVWEGIRKVQRANVPLPPWVRGYLANVGDQLHVVGKQPRNARTAPRRVYAALGFSARRPVTMMADSWRDVQIAHAIYTELVLMAKQMPHPKVTAAVRLVADRHGLSVSDAWRIWKKFKDEPWMQP